MMIGAELAIDKPSPSKEAREKLSLLVSRFLDHANQYRSSAGNYNEHSCRDEFINPFLEILGWDVSNKQGVAPQYREVIAENHSTESDFPDYTLTLSGAPKFFLEAKKPSVNIIETASPALQARRYGWNKGHMIAALTNFDYLTIYDTTIMPDTNDEPYVARYKTWHCDEYLASFDEIYSLMSRESVYSGYFDQHLGRNLLDSNHDKQRVNSVFLEQINGWRLKIAESIFSNNIRYRNQDLLNEAIQDFVNQIIFLRICEDRGLPIPECLRALPRKDIHAEINSLYDQVDRRFNSGLFHHRAALNDCSPAVIDSILDDLYYPKSPFLFDVIDPSIFGQIYEMFLSEQVAINGDNLCIAPKKEYSNRSVVATPSDIARHIVIRALEPLCANKTPYEILSLKIGDIACGSGIFLIEVFQYLCNKMLEWYYINDIKHLIPCADGAHRLPIEDKRKILTNCIFGLDIDSGAVEVAKLSLLIKLIEEETAESVSVENPVLPNLDHVVITGNALISSSEISSHELDTDVLEEIVPFDWIKGNEALQFDAIVGNPPYVQTKDMRTLLPSEEFSAYIRCYKSAYKQFDKYFLFIERALHLLKDDGRACIIVPNKFYKIATGVKLRELLSARKCIASIENFGSTQLFAEKTIYSAILCLTAEENDRLRYTERYCSNVSGFAINSRSTSVLESDLGADPWRLTVDVEFLGSLNELEKRAVPISKHVDFFNGIQTSAETKKTYWFSLNEIAEEDESTFTFRRKNNKWRIEKAILKRYFKPTEQHGYNSFSVLSADKLIIFPYDRDGRLYSIEELETHFPNTWAYLLQQKKDLWPRQLGGDGKRDVPGATIDTWYQFGRSQALATFNGLDKIIVGILSKEPLYYIDRDDWVIASGGTAGYCGARMKQDSPYSLEYLQAWLSSSCIEQYFSIVGSDFEGEYKSRGTSLLKSAPFLELDLNNRQQKRLYQAVNDYSTRIQEINCQLTDEVPRKKMAVLSHEKEDLIDTLDQVIEDIFYLRF